MGSSPIVCTKIKKSKKIKTTETRKIRKPKTRKPKQGGAVG